MIKYLTLLLAFYLPAFVLAQSPRGLDNELKFDKRFTQCERRWVVLSKRDTASSYSFGFIYLDAQAGFTYDHKGSFKVNEHGKYIADTTGSALRSLKYRIAANWKPVAWMPQKIIKELKLPAQPSWINLYYKYTDTVARYYRWGWVYNDINEPDSALVYLNKAYKINPNAPGVATEMTFAYNALKQYRKAIEILEPAIKHDPKQAYLFKELGYAYLHLLEYDKAINAFKQGLSLMPGDEQSDIKGELAFNMARAYKAANKMDEYLDWMEKAKAYTPKTSELYKQIMNSGNQ